MDNEPLVYYKFTFGSGELIDLKMIRRRAVYWVSNNYFSYASVTQMQNNRVAHT